MKNRNIALAALLVLGSAVLAASKVLVVVPQKKSGTATDVSERTQVILEESQLLINEFKVDDVAQASIVKERLERTQEIVVEAQESAGLK